MKKNESKESPYVGSGHRPSQQGEKAKYAKRMRLDSFFSASVVPGFSLRLRLYN